MAARSQRPTWTSQHSTDESTFLATEEERRKVTFFPTEPVVRSFLPQELIVLHLFSGRRRSGDLQSKLEELSIPAGTILTVASVDVAIDAKRCNLADPRQQAMWYRFIAAGSVAGVFGGPPCETWSIARFQSAPAHMKRPRRPLRTRHNLWGLLDISMKERAQTEMGNMLMLFNLRAVILQAVTGGFGFLEHPANPHSLGTSSKEAPAIWLAAVIEWLQQTTWFCVLDVMQGMYGQDSAKPT